MDPKALDKAFAEHQGTVIDWARQTGPSSVLRLKPYLKSTDREQRLLAIDAIIAAGGPELPDILMEAINDRDEQVRYNAANALYIHKPIGRHEDLQNHLVKNTDPIMRRHAALLLGIIDPPKDSLHWLKHQQKVETDREVTDAIIASRAKLGDGEARDEFGRLLIARSGPDIKELIDLSKYIDQPWVAKRLQPVLAKEEIALDISSHRTKLTRRSCDLAIDEIARLTGHEFSFPVTKTANYTLMQREEVRAFIDGWTPPAATGAN
jgi:hypothetical protein